MRHRMILAVALTIGAILVPTPASAATTVDWSDAFPTTGNVTIPKGTTAILDTDLDLATLTINGKVRCGTKSVDITARWILVTETGAFVCGTHKNPFTKKVTITLKGDGSKSVGGYGDKFLAVAGGRLDLHGKEKVSWVRLTHTAARGATELRLEPNDWKVGDTIVVVSTDFAPEQAEEVTIIGKSGNRVTIDEPLEYLHYCGAAETYKERSVSECAEVGNLDRNITVRGNADSESSLIGGHGLFLQGSVIRIEDAAFKRMGQAGRLGRYPLHFHLFGNAKDSYVRRTATSHAFNRFISFHAVRNLRFRDNVGFDTFGHGFYLEDAAETGNELVGNLGALVREPAAQNLLTPSDTDASVYWISNMDNVFEDNVAAGGDFAGFWCGLPEHPLGPSYDPDMWPRQIPLDTFDGNTAHSNGFTGLYLDGGEQPDRTVETTWYNPRQVPGDNDSPHVRPVFRDFTSYKNRHYGMWVRTFSGAKFENAVYADNWRGVYLANIRSGPSGDNVGLLKDSLIVAETNNKGQPASWEPTGKGGRSLPLPWDEHAELGGVPFYDGPMRVNNVVFANFEPSGLRDAGALTSLFPDEFWISPANAVQKAKFVNSRKVLLPDVETYVDGDASTMFTDLDGSVTGNPGSRLVVKGSLMHTSGCTNRPAWNAFECDLSHFGISVYRLDGTPGPIRVTRADGKRQSYDGSGDANSLFFTIVGNRKHEVEWLTGTPDSFNLYVNGVSPGTGSKKAARLAIPVRSGFSIPSWWGEEAGSLGQLDGGGSKWFYQASTGLLHLRLVGEGNWLPVTS